MLVTEVLERPTALANATCVIPASVRHPANSFPNRLQISSRFKMPPTVTSCTRQVRSVNQANIEMYTHYVCYTNIINRAMLLCLTQTDRGARFESIGASGSKFQNCPEKSPLKSLSVAFENERGSMETPNSEA